MALWPVSVAGEGGRHLSFAEALGPGGERVERLLDALAAVPRAAEGQGGVDLAAQARVTPGGTVTLPLVLVSLPAAVEAAAHVDRVWLAEVEGRRTAPRRALVAAGRAAEMEAALHVAILVATERLDPADDADVGAHVASGAQLWLLAGAVVSALAGVEPDPFEGWAHLVADGWWPVGPSGGRLVVGEVEPSPLGVAVARRRA